VDGIPFEADNLAAAQAVEGTQQNRDFQIGAARRLKERVYLICIVEAGHIAFFLWALYSICRVGCDQIQLYRVFQRFMDDGMIMDHRTAAYSLALLQIKLLDVFRSPFLQGRATFVKIWDNHAVGK